MPPSTKYIFVSGGVLSGLGKGTVVASLGYLFKQHGLTVAPIKCENYLNFDSGLINPIEHGDAFLCDDGTETDMDLGNYERFLGRDLHKHNFITLGQIYKAVIDRERSFGYGGEDVEAIPHVTDEIIRRIKQAAETDQAEICIIELGGTVGEYQNVLYYEASRIMKLTGGDTVVHVHVSYLPTPPHVGEPKTKPTQLSVKALNAMSIQPDFLVARTESDLDMRRRDRLALFCNMHASDVIINKDEESIYQVPLAFHEQDFDKKILAKLGLPDHDSDITAWQNLVKKVLGPKKSRVTIAIVGKYFATGDYNLTDSYAALIEAVRHAAIAGQVDLELRYINSKVIEQKGTSILKDVNGIIVPIGWGARGTEGKIAAIKYARENQVPYLGLCYGLQLAVVEFARNKAGLTGANSTEIDPDTKDPVVYIIPEQLRNVESRAYGGTMRLGAWDCDIKPGTLASKIYGGAKSVSERHRHRYEVNNSYLDQLAKHGLVFSGISPEEGLVEFIELPRDVHPFFFATQAHPEYKSRPLAPHPVFLSFLDATVDHSKST